MAAGAAFHGKFWPEMVIQLAGAPIDVAIDADNIMDEAFIVSGQQSPQIERAAVKMAGGDIHFQLGFVGLQA